MQKNGRYSRRIFAGKDIPVYGITEGYGRLYRRGAVDFSVNAFWDGAFQGRDGQKDVMTFEEGSIRLGYCGKSSCIIAGTCLYVDSEGTI
jgi:hypothetical protein